MESLLDTMDPRGCQLYGFWGGNETWGDRNSGIQFPVLLVTESFRLFYVLECLYEFVFEFICRDFVEDPIAVGVCQRRMCLIGAILFVHDDHAQPLVCFKYHP